MTLSRMHRLAGAISALGGRRGQMLRRRSAVAAVHKAVQSFSSSRSISSSSSSGITLVPTTMTAGSYVPRAAPSEYHRGHHVVIDVVNAVCKGHENVTKMGNELLSAMATGARDAGANVLMTHVEIFGDNSPPGFAAVVLLDESHVSAHCYSDLGLVAIDAFTCGETPSTTERVAEHIAKHLKAVFPEASLHMGAMRRFGHFDVGKYLSEFYGGEKLSTGNEQLLRFFHDAYGKIGRKQQGKPYRLLEVGGGPTMHQLLSASAHASEIVFTDLVQGNVDHVRRHIRESSSGATRSADAKWKVYSDYVAQLEGASSGNDSTSPLRRLCEKIVSCEMFDVGNPSLNFPEASFDVISAVSVFDHSGIGGRDWKDHLANVTRLLKPSGHIVLVVGSGQAGDRELPQITAEDLQKTLRALKFSEVEVQSIDAGTAVTARKAPQANPVSDSQRQARHNIVAEYTRHTYRHFNAAALIQAADGYRDLMASGGKMVLTLAGAMSTGQIGVTLAEMIRADKVHAISCTGANLEEDFFNLVANSRYFRIPDWRGLSKEEEQRLCDSGFNRVTDTCIPEEAAIRTCEEAILQIWREALAKGETMTPHELFYKLIRDGTLADKYEIDPADSWLVAAAEKNLPIVVPGWEDSTVGSLIISNRLLGNIDGFPMKSGLEQLMGFCKWYMETQEKHDIGFFQIGGGIAGDFPICSVPLIRQDLDREDVKLWSYFCQVSDGTTSYGGYSAAPPNEKITWGKLSPTTPSFIVESDATIVWPLVCSLVLAE